MYDYKNFGNVIVEISSHNNLNIRFIKNRGDVSCELGKAGEWFWIDDVFAILGIKPKQIDKNIIDCISNISVQIKQNLPNIFKAFDEQNIKNTKNKIKDIAIKRVMGLL